MLHGGDGRGSCLGSGGCQEGVGWLVKAAVFEDVGDERVATSVGAVLDEPDLDVVVSTGVDLDQGCAERGQKLPGRARRVLSLPDGLLEVGAHPGFDDAGSGVQDIVGAGIDSRADRLEAVDEPSDQGDLGFCHAGLLIA